MAIKTERQPFSAVTVSVKAGLLRYYLKETKKSSILTFEVLSFFYKKN